MSRVSQLEKQIAHALHIAESYGTVSGAHHKMWVIDQMVRALTGPDYDEWVEGYDFEMTDFWSRGVHP